jgi:hypothetical protein
VAGSRSDRCDAAEEGGPPPPDVAVTISIPGGELLADKAINARLGIVGAVDSGDDKYCCRIMIFIIASPPAISIRIRRAAGSTPAFDRLAGDHPFATAEMVS